MPAIPTLVIGCGNQLRTDDGVGPAAAGIVESWHTPGIKVRIVQQLLPELIDELANVDRILFLDAAINQQDCPFRLVAVEPRKSNRILGHHATPASLLALLRELNGNQPEAFLLTISASSFEHGAELKTCTQENLQAALLEITRWIQAPRSSIGTPE